MVMIEIRAGNSPELEAYLAQRIYEYNAAATGYHDGESFAAIHQTEPGKLEAGAYGYTWGGCCYISYLWASNGLRRRGIGSELLDAIERHARQKRCRLILLSTHSFQAPGFYVRRGYEEVTQIKDYPVGHARASSSPNNWIARESELTVNICPPTSPTRMKGLSWR